MKRVLFLFIMLVALLFIIVELAKTETFQVVQKEVDLVHMKSNKRLNPSYKRAIVNLTDAEIVNESGEKITANLLQIGDELIVDFKGLVGLSEPPLLSAKKVILIE